MLPRIQPLLPALGPGPLPQAGGRRPQGLRPAGILCALHAEAACLARAGIREADAAASTATRLIITGTGGAAARAGSRQLLEAGAGSLISWGFAGGLDPELPAGALLLPETVRIGAALHPTYPAWRERLLEALRSDSPHTRPLLHTDRALTDPQDKDAAFRQSRAAACDMESGVIAAEAARARVPFLVLRAVTDPAARTVPPWLPAAVSDGGTGKAALQAAAHPGDWPALLRLYLDLRAATRTLRRAAGLLRRVVCDGAGPT